MLGWSDGAIVGLHLALQRPDLVSTLVFGGGVFHHDGWHRQVRVPVLVIVGDDDEVRFDHVVDMYEALPDAELAVIPRSTHGLIVEKPDVVALFVRDLHRGDRSDGVAPRRRATRA